MRLLLLATSVLYIAGTSAAPAAAPKNCAQGPYGAGGGYYFSDAAMGDGRPIKTVKVRSGKRIDSIQITYGNFEAPQRGWNGGVLSYFQLEEGETIIRVEGRANTRVDNLKFFTSAGRQFGPFGAGGGSEFVALGKDLKYISGRSGTELDQLIFHFDSC